MRAASAESSSKGCQMLGHFTAHRPWRYTTLTKSHRFLAGEQLAKATSGFASLKPRDMSFDLVLLEAVKHGAGTCPPTN